MRDWMEPFRFTTDSPFLTALFLAFAIILLKPTVNWLVNNGITALNYRGVRIPNRLGIYLWLITLVYFLLVVLASGTVPAAYALYMLALSVVVWSGWVDDAAGGNEAKGLRGHIRYSWRQGAPTSGLLKALTIGAASFVLAFESASSLPSGILAATVTALSANAVNLLDLRPGRALKAFFILTLPVILFCFAEGWGTEARSYMLPVTWGAVLLFPGDLRSRWMLGDTGANFLGFALGYWVTRFTPWWYQTGLAVLLALLHWVSERRSLSAMIDHFRWLRWLDRLGRV